MELYAGMDLHSRNTYVGILEGESKKRIYDRTSLKKATDIFSVSETISFLLSDDARSITGQNIHVDSGTI